MDADEFCKVRIRLNRSMARSLRLKSIRLDQAPFFDPISICLDEGIGEFNQLSDKRNKGEFWWLSGFNHGLILRLEVSR